jgi:hypothetical protein
VNASEKRVRAVKALLEKHRGVFISPGRTTGKAPSEFEFAIELKPDTRPVKQPNRPVHPAMKQELKSHLEQLLEDECIEPSCSPWASPIVPVRKRMAVPDSALIIGA